MEVTFWAAAVGIPAVLVIGNAVVRHGLGMAQSAGADVGLMFAAFDGVVLTQADEFRPHVRHPDLASDLTGIFVLLLFFSLLSWIILVIQEQKIVTYHAALSAGTVPGPTYPLVATFLSYALPFVVTVLNLLSFVYGP
jgi:hypothetical protein